MNTSFGRSDASQAIVPPHQVQKKKFNYMDKGGNQLEERKRKRVRVLKKRNKGKIQKA